MRGFAHSVYRCFVDLEKAFDHVLWGALWGYSMSMGFGIHCYRPFSPYTSGIRVWFALPALSWTPLGSPPGYPIVTDFVYKVYGKNWLVQPWRVPGLVALRFYLCYWWTLRSCWHCAVLFSFCWSGLQPCEATCMRINTSKSKAMVLS